jgi:hypothetical protein
VSANCSHQFTEIIDGTARDAARLLRGPLAEQFPKQAHVVHMCVLRQICFVATAAVEKLADEECQNREVSARSRLQ